MNKVACSVIITCFNKEKFLDDCLESIKRQTRQPKEVILVHDACDEPMAHAYAHTIILPENVGVSKARDIGFKYSSQELILFVDGDDVLSPDYLEKMVLVLADGADIVYPDLYIWQGEAPSLSVPPDKLTPAYVKKNYKLPLPVTSLMKRSIYEDLGGFKDMVVLEDLDFFVRAMCKGYTFKKAHTLLWYRRYGDVRNSLLLDRRKEMREEIVSQLDEKK